MSETNLTKVYIELSTTDKPETAIRKIGSMFESKGGDFKIEQLLTEVAGKTSLVLENKKPISSIKSLKEAFERALVRSERAGSIDGYIPTKILKEEIPQIPESVMIESLDQLEGWNLRRLLYENIGITKNVLKAIMERLIRPGGSWGHTKLQIMTAVKNHQLCDDEILWIAARSSLVSVRIQVINKANAEMLEYIETYPGKTPLSKAMKQAIAKRKMQLNL